MSWIRGVLILEKNDKKSLSHAYADISSEVRHNADLEEFPNMGEDIFPIKELTNTVFDSEIDAEEYCISKGHIWARNYNVIVAFRDTSCAKNTKRIQTLEERKNKEIVKLNEYTKSHSISSFKSKLITCPNCESKINKNYIHNDICPLCRTDLRSDTTKTTLARYKSNIKKLEKEIAQEKAKHKEKLPIHYLVMFEEYIG